MKEFCRCRGQTGDIRFKAVKLDTASLYGVQCRFQQFFSYIAAASASIHAFPEFFFFFSFDQYSAQYSFQATGCFPT